PRRHREYRRRTDALSHHRAQPGGSGGDRRPHDRWPVDPRRRHGRDEPACRQLGRRVRRQSGSLRHRAKHPGALGVRLWRASMHRTEPRKGRDADSVRRAGPPPTRAAAGGIAGSAAIQGRVRHLRHEGTAGHVVTRNELRYDEQVAVISGAGGGLGKEYALLLASRGARIVVNDIGGSVTGHGSSTEAANAVAEEIGQRGGQAVADSHSVTTPEGGQAIIDTALRTWGRVDIVINNAGIVRDAPFQDMTPERIQPLVDVHLNGAFHVTRPAWKVMREQRYGRIINTCSAAGIL